MVSLSGMRNWRFLSALTLSALLLAACGNVTEVTPTPDPTDPDPQEPEPATCAVTISDHIAVSDTWVNSASECDYYLVGRISLSAQLNIEPGTTIVAAKEAKLDIEDGGRIVAVGTAESPIRFIGQQAVPGAWYGLCFSGSHYESTFDHVEIYWAGGVWAHGSHVCRAGIGGVNKGGEAVNITNSRIIGSYTSGIDATRFQLGDFSNNVLAGHREYGLRVSPNNMGRLDETTDYSGNSVSWEDGSSAANGLQYVYLDSQVMDVTGGVQLWKPLDVPYYLRQDDFTYGTSALWLDANVIVQVEAGTHFVMGPGDVSLLVEYGSVLALAGEEGNEIVFSSELGAQGSWEGIWMAGGVMLADHVVFADGGQPDGLIQDAIVTFSNVGFPSNCSDIRNTTFRNSASSGVSVDDDYADFVHLDEASLTFSNNADLDIKGVANGPPVIDGVSCT